MPGPELCRHRFCEFLQTNEITDNPKGYKNIRIQLHQLFPFIRCALHFLNIQQKRDVINCTLDLSLIPIHKGNLNQGLKKFAASLSRRHIKSVFAEKKINNKVKCV
jgi:hypothetical protein